MYDHCWIETLRVELRNMSREEQEMSLTIFSYSVLSIWSSLLFMGVRKLVLTSCLVTLLVTLLCTYYCYYFLFLVSNSCTISSTIQFMRRNWNILNTGNISIFFITIFNIPHQQIFYRVVSKGQNRMNLHLNGCRFYTLEMTKNFLVPS